MVRTAYVPDTDDLVWLDFERQLGREQAGRRPGLVLSPASYNRRSGLAVVCPVTSRIKGYPFEVILPAHLPVQGAVLCDQLKSFDWAARRAEKAARAPTEVTAEVRSRIAVLLGITGW